jgi:YegS/Rv2252/BmrU family lipid kinase
MRVHAIINPAAGWGRGARVWPRVRPVFEDAGWTLHESRTERRGHAMELAAATPAEIVIAVGGDGTVHEVANGLLRTGSPAALGVVPVGTGSDFARALRLPRDPVAAAAALVTAGRRRIDVGEVNGRCFLTISGVGFDGEVAQQVNHWPKVFGGTPMYLLGILKNLVTYRPVDVEIVLDGQPQRERLFLIAVGNTAWNAGGMWLVPPAQPDDGIFDIVIAGPLTTFETLRVLPGVFSGRHLQHPKVRQARAREIHISSAVPLAIQADGESLGRLPATYTVRPAALPVLAPANGC